MKKILQLSWLNWLTLCFPLLCSLGFFIASLFIPGFNREAFGEKTDLIAIQIWINFMLVWLVIAIITSLASLWHPFPLFVFLSFSIAFLITMGSFFGLLVSATPYFFICCCYGLIFGPGWLLRNRHHG